jgi:hypothetical protein
MNTIEQSRKYRRVFVLAVLLLSCVGTVCFAAEQSKPTPEHKKLEVWLGDWNYSGEGKESPFGPAGKFEGSESAKLVLNGFFVESRWRDKTQDGFVAEGITFIGYDPVKKEYFDHGFDMDGIASSSRGTVQGNVWISHGTRTDSKGKVYQTRFTRKLSPDGNTVTVLSEYSSDGGKTWMTWWNLKSHKVKK